MTIKAAERMHTQPWVIDDDPAITPYEWANRAVAVAHAEAAADAWRHKRDERRAGMRASRGRR